MGVTAADTPNLPAPEVDMRENQSTFVPDGLGPARHQRRGILGGQDDRTEDVGGHSTDLPNAPLREYALVLGGPLHGAQRARVLRRWQSTYGNNAVQRLLNPGGLQAEQTADSTIDASEVEAHGTAMTLVQEPASRVQRRASGDIEPATVQRKGVWEKIKGVLAPEGRPLPAKETYLNDRPFGDDYGNALGGNGGVIKGHALNVLSSLAYENARMDSLFWSGVLSAEDRGKATKPPGWDARVAGLPDLSKKPEIVREAFQMWQSWNQYRYWTAWIFEGDNSLWKKSYRRGQTEEQRREAKRELTEKSQYANFVSDRLGEEAVQVIKLAK